MGKTVVEISKETLAGMKEAGITTVNISVKESKKKKKGRRKRFRNAITDGFDAGAKAVKSIL